MPASEPKVIPRYLTIACNRSSDAMDSCGEEVVYAANNMIAVYNLKTRLIATLKGHSDKITSVKCLNNSTLVSVSKNTCKLWRFDSQKLRWKCTQTLQDHPDADSITCIGVQKHQFGQETGSEIVFATASTGNIIYVYTTKFIHGVETTTIVETITTPSFVLTMMFSKLPHSETSILVTAGVNSLITCYVKKEIYEKSIVLKGHADWVRSLDIIVNRSPPTSKNDPRLGDVLIASASQDRYIRIWKISIQEEQLKLNDFEEMCERMERLSTKAQIVKINDTSYAFTFDALLMGHDDWVHSIRWLDPSDNSKNMLISSSADKTVMCWETDANTNIWVNTVRVGDVGGDTLGFYNALFTQTLIIASSYNGSIHIWKRCGKNNSPELGASGHFGRVEEICWDPTGTYFSSVSADESMRTYTYFNERWNEIGRPMTHGHPIKTIVYHSKYGFVSGSDEKILRVYEAPSTFIRSLSALLNTNIDISEESMNLRAIGASLPALGLTNKAIYQNDDLQATSSQSKNGTTTTLQYSFNVLTEAPFESHLIQNTLWPEVDKLYGHGNELLRVCSNVSGSLIASCCRATNADDATIIVWNTQNWKQVGVLKGHDLSITCLAFSIAGNLVSSGRDRSICLWRCINEEWILLQKIEKAHGRIVWDCTWSYDGTILCSVSRDKSLKIWLVSEAGTLVLIGTCKFEQSCTAAAFSPDMDGIKGHLLAVGFESGEIVIFQVTIAEGAASTERFCSIDSADTPSNQVTSLRWRPDTFKNGLVLACSSADHSVRVYEIVSVN